MSRKWQRLFKGRVQVHGSVHVSKSKYFCSLHINDIALKTQLIRSSVSHAIVSRGRITDDQKSQKISVDFPTLLTVGFSFDPYDSFHG